MQATTIQNPRFSTREAGKVIKSSKKVFTWEFTMENNSYKIEFFHSKVSGMRRLSLNGNKILEVKDKTNEFKFNFLHKDKNWTVYQVNPTSYELIVDGITFSRLLIDKEPSPGASVRQAPEVQLDQGHANEEENKHTEENNYPELDIYESYVNPEAKAQVLMDEIFGGCEPKAEAAVGNEMLCSVSTAQTANMVNSRIGAEEAKESVIVDPFEAGLEKVRAPQRTLSSKQQINLMEFEPIMPRRQVSDLLGEIDFFADEKQAVMMFREAKQQPTQIKNQKGVDIDIFSNLAITNYLLN
jgi:hypothetical protein